MAKSIIELTRGIPTTAKGWLDIFGRLNRFLKVSGDQLIIGGDLVLPPESVGTDEIADEAVTDVKLRQSQARSVIGRSLGSAGAPTDIQAASDGHFLRRAGGVLSFGPIAESDIPDEIARDGEVSDAIDAHEAAVDPHPTYATAAEVASAISTALTNITGGTYSPTLTSVANTDAITTYDLQYMRIGSVVHVSGRIDINPTAAVLTQVGISLPVASNIGAAADCAGNAFDSGASQGAAIYGDAANNRAMFEYVATDTANRDFYFTFTYRVI